MTTARAEHNPRRYAGRGRPCPVCGSGTKGCNVSEDGLHRCRGRAGKKGEEAGDFFCCGEGNGNGWYFWRRKGERGPGRRDRAPEDNGHARGGVDWRKRQDECEAALPAARLEELAEALGVPAHALKAVGLGWSERDGAWTFPEKDASGGVVGILRRWPGDRPKKVMGGGSRGLSIPRGFQFPVSDTPGGAETGNPLLLPEGPSCVAAAVAMALPAVGRPSNAGGTRDLADFLAGTDCPLVVMGEFDANDRGEWPGRDGAFGTAKKLAAALARTVWVAFPPDRAKDVRAWFNAQGLDHLSSADECHAAGERFLAGLRRIAVEPPDGGEEDPELIQSAEDIPTLADARAAGAVKRWLWEKWIQADVPNGLGGEFGHGKTRLVMELFRRIRAGEPWPDGSPMTLPRDSVFLFVPADYQHSELTDVAEKYGVPDDCVFLNSAKDEPEGADLFDSPKALARLERRIAVLRPALVVVDPVTGSTADRSHCSAEDSTAIYRPLQRMARKYKVAFLVLIHLNREGGVYGRHAKGKFRSGMKLTKVETPGGERYRLEVDKTNSKTPAALGGTQKDGGWEFDDSPPEVEAPAKRGPRSKAVREAMEFLRKALAGGPRLQCELVREWEEAGHSNKTLFQAADALREEGELEDGESPSPKGRKMLKAWRLRQKEQDEETLEERAEKAFP